jgi:hypothetical protein
VSVTVGGGADAAPVAVAVSLSDMRAPFRARRLVVRADPIRRRPC